MSAAIFFLSFPATNWNSFCHFHSHVAVLKNVKKLDSIDKYIKLNQIYDDI